MNDIVQDAKLDTLRRCCNSLSMGIAQTELTNATAADGVASSLNVLQLAMTDAEQENVNHWQIQLHSWENALAPRLDEAGVLALCCDVIEQSLKRSESLAAFDDWAAEEEATLLAGLEAIETHTPEPVTTDTSAAVTEDSVDDAQTAVETLESVAQEDMPSSPAASATAQEPAASAASDASTQTSRVGRRGLSLKRQGDAEAADVAPPSTTSATATIDADAAESVAATESVAEHVVEAEEAPPATTFTDTNTVSCAEFFAALPWQKPLAAAPAIPAAADMAEHLHIGSGHTQKSGIHAPPAAHNPVLAATAQALQAAEEAAAPASAATGEPHASPGAVFKNSLKQASTAFFSQLPWQGK
jgi:hypothetical protein